MSCRCMSIIRPGIRRAVKPGHMPGYKAECGCGELSEHGDLARWWRTIAHIIYAAGRVSGGYVRYDIAREQDTRVSRAEWQLHRLRTSDAKCFPAILRTNTPLPP